MMFAAQIEGWPEWLIYAGALVGSVVAIVGILRRWVVEPVGRQLRDTIREELAPVQKRVDDIANEVQFNGGSSLKDAVRRIEHRQTRIEGQVDTIMQVVNPGHAPGRDAEAV
jgi:hypothetical protein